MPHYRIVDGAAVRPEIREIAEKAAAAACVRLGIPGVAVRWFEKVSAEGPDTITSAADALGLARKSRLDEILIRVDQDRPESVATSAAHEVFHIAAWRAGVPDTEEMADSFAAKLARQLGYDVLSMHDVARADVLLSAMSQLGREQ
jgi:hypothetical protein